MKQRKGFTLIELLVVIAIIALLVGLLLPALAKAQQNARSLKDKTQIKQIHAAMLVYANDAKERLPTPGLIDRLEDLQLNLQVPGMGPHDYEQNHSANLYSYMISTQFFGTKLLIGPTEVNPFIDEYVNFNFDAYDPSIDVYWDPLFNVDISQDDVDGVHVSYFHMTLVGERWRTKWRTESTHSAAAVIMGSRGTENGDINNDNYRLSQTLELHGAKNQWVGNLVFQDNHTETVVSFYPNQVIYQRQDGNSPTPDNIFDAEFNDFPLYGDEQASGDTWLTLTGPAGLDQYTAPETFYDPLVP